MGHVIADLRFAFRTLSRNKGFSAVAILSIALGMAVNATVFSWMDALLLRPINGVERGSDLIVIKSLAANGQYIDSSYLDFRDLRDQTPSLAGVIAFRQHGFLLGDPPQMDRVWGEMVSGNYFDVLGVKPVLGRTFARDEQSERPGASPVAVISERLWRSRFQSNPGAAGLTVRLNRHAFQIVGVVPESFRGTMPGLQFDIWVPITMQGQLTGDWDWLEDRNARPLALMARLKPGGGVEQAEAEVSAVAKRLAQEYPNSNRGVGAAAMSIADSPDGAQSVLGPVVKILLGVSGLVLLIVCANIGNLLLSRATARQKEFGVRLSIGATRGRLIQQLLTESVVLCLLGGVVGFMASGPMATSLSLLLPATDLPAGVDIRFDTLSMVFTAGLCLLTAVLCGLAPSVRFSRTDPQEALRQGARGTTSGPRSLRMRGLMVTGEVSLALVALAGAGLFLKSFHEARRVNPGFDADRVLLAGIDLSSAGCAQGECLAQVERLRERLAQVPGATSASVADRLPLGFDLGAWEGLDVEGYVPRTAENMKIYRCLVGPGYLDVLGIGLAEGRDFDRRDSDASQPVAIVNETFAKRFFGGGPAIGRKIKGWGEWVTIVGIARDSKYQHIAEAPLPYFYAPLAQHRLPGDGLTFVIRTAGRPGGLTGHVRRELQTAAGAVGITGVAPLSEYIGAAYFMYKAAAAALSVLGTIAISLALIGLYGVMAYSITQRTQEIGIRIALGAAPRAILTQVVGDGLKLAVPGVCAGLMLALAASRVASSLLYGVSATDAGVLTLSCLIVLMMSLLVAYIPARRASRLDPIVALRQE
jgi:predicted permease